MNIYGISKLKCVRWSEVRHMQDLHSSGHEPDVALIIPGHELRSSVDRPAAL